MRYNFVYEYLAHLGAVGCNTTPRPSPSTLSGRP